MKLLEEKTNQKINLFKL